MAETLDNPASRYGTMDRLFHRLAFSMIDLQIDLAAREDREHNADLSLLRTGAPTFVTGLPRAGTTLLLDVLSVDPGVASHTYRDMPVLFCPLTWRQFSVRFHRRNEPTERAHGDGLAVGYDSPEAFEEALWLHFWRDHYGENEIAPWREKEAHADFSTFLERHMRKIILNARNSSRPDATRYLSKNNANIARSGWLKREFPEARILVPFRHPANHAASLLRQHQNFTRLHASDGFAKKYMSDLGHFEFGALHKPIRFTGFNPPASDNPDRSAYWLRYWVAAYMHLLSRPESELILVDFDALCWNPRPGLSLIADLIEAEAPALILGQEQRFRPPAEPDWSGLNVPAELQAQAEALHARLRAKSVT